MCLQPAPSIIVCNILVVYGDEGSYEETSARISTIPGGDRAGSLQETFADTPKCDHDRLEKSRLGV